MDAGRVKFVVIGSTPGGDGLGSRTKPLAVADTKEAAEGIAVELKAKAEQANKFIVGAGYSYIEIVETPNC